MIEGISAHRSPDGRASARSPAALIAERLRDRIPLPDPDAPTGPPPSFEVSPLERLRETRRSVAPRPVDDGSRFAAYGDLAPERRRIDLTA